MFTAPDSPRAVDPHSLTAPGGIPAAVAPELPDALDHALAHPGPVLVTGSLYLVGSALDHLAGTGKFQPSHQ